MTSWKWSCRAAILVFPTVPMHSIELIGNRTNLIRKHHLTSQRLNLKYPCAFLQFTHPRQVNGYFFIVGNFPCLLKSYVHIHYSSEHQMNTINIRRTRPQHIYNKWQSAHSEIWRNIYALHTHIPSSCTVSHCL